jgi:hypothetical protein
VADRAVISSSIHKKTGLIDKAGFLRARQLYANP